MSPSPNYHGVFSGYEFIGEAPKFVIFLPVACKNCFTIVALNELHLQEEKEENFLEAGLERFQGTKPPPGYQISTEGPIYCTKCLALWREGKLDSDSPPFSAEILNDF
jgi:hypothetical protein